MSFAVPSTPAYGTHMQSNGGIRPTPQDVDKLVNEHGLSGQRQLVHRFNEVEVEEQTLLLYILGLRQEAVFAGFHNELKAMNTSLSRIELTRLLKALLRHYLIKPNATYGKVNETVESYIWHHATTLNLEIYVSDPIVRSTTNKYLHTQFAQVKGAFRKLLWRVTDKKTALDVWAKEVLCDYHLPAIPKSVPTDVLASFALMRDVAAPLVPNKVPRGGDTGFWPALEARLDKLYDAHGKDRCSDAWKAWETEIISNDDEKYGRRTTRSVAFDRNEVASALTDAQPGEGAAHAGAVPAPAGSTSAETEELDLDALNLAATAV
ncbi:hypothetical protein PLICRDRAFT_26185 [Plicaturopsis crispa FD-325 SS-3]|nr:hypothetical protein PLICRDRAFT_26185 [Plicaturopsis crispa FD-325 SS-3]